MSRPCKLSQTSILERALINYVTSIIVLGSVLGVVEC